MEIKSFLITIKPNSLNNINNKILLLGVILKIYKQVNICEYL